MIDHRVVELVRRQHEKAKKLLEANRDKLDELAQYLYEKETITGKEFMRILKGTDAEENTEDDEGNGPEAKPQEPEQALPAADDAGKAADSPAADGETDKVETQEPRKYNLE
jgi:cell division protease FtsH